jgi:hypothetical protein
VRGASALKATSVSGRGEWVRGAAPVENKAVSSEDERGCKRTWRGLGSEWKKRESRGVGEIPIK